jgi:hypothetical protein
VNSDERPNSSSSGNYILGTYTNLLGSSSSHGGNSSNSNIYNLYKYINSLIQVYRSYTGDHTCVCLEFHPGCLEELPEPSPPPSHFFH